MMLYDLEEMRDKLQEKKNIKKIAIEIGIDPRVLRKIKKGQACDPKYSTLLAITNFLNRVEP